MLVTRFAFLRVARSAMGGCREVDVSQTASAASGDQDTLSGRDQVRKDVVRRVVECHSAWRHAQIDVATSLAMTTRALSTTAARRSKMMLETIITERRQPGVNDQIDRSPATSVTSVRTTLGYVCLPPKGGCSVTASPGRDGQRDVIEEHGARKTSEATSATGRRHVARRRPCRRA